METLFAALKSRGFELEATHLTAPDHIHRLIGLLAVAFAWSYLVGENRAETEKPQPERPTAAAAEAEASSATEQGSLTTLDRQRAAFDTCIQVLRTPQRVFLWYLGGLLAQPQTARSVTQDLLGDWDIDFVIACPSS